jgi:hypothetical protein
MNIRIHRHMIVGESVGHESPEPAVGQGPFMQRNADAPDDGAQNLAARGRRIEDAPGCHSADHLPSVNSTWSSLAPASGAPAIFCGNTRRSFCTARQAAWMAEPVEEVVNTLPSTGSTEIAELRRHIIKRHRGGSRCMRLMTPL